VVRNTTSIFAPRPTGASHPRGGRRTLIPDRSRSTRPLPAASTAPLPDAGPHGIRGPHVGSQNDPPARTSTALTPPDKGSTVSKGRPRARARAAAPLTQLHARANITSASPMSKFPAGSGFRESIPPQNTRFPVRPNLRTRRARSASHRGVVAVVRNRRQQSLSNGTCRLLREVRHTERGLRCSFAAMRRRRRTVWRARIRKEHRLLVFELIHLRPSSESTLAQAIVVASDTADGGRATMGGRNGTLDSSRG
jgi:hypothetical protein